MSLQTPYTFEFYIFSQDKIVLELMQKIIEIEQRLLFLIDFKRVLKCYVRPLGTNPFLEIWKISKQYCYSGYPLTTVLGTQEYLLIHVTI